jgi:DNA-binding CsgD family transcriptional regulator
VVFAIMRLQLGDVDGAEAIFSDLASFASAMGDYFGLGETSMNLAGIALIRQDNDRAVGHFREGLRCGQLIDTFYLIADAVEGLAVVLARRADAQRAARLFGAIDTLRARSGFERSPFRNAYLNPAIESLRDEFGTEAFETMRNVGRTMPIEDVIADAETAGTFPTVARSDITLLTGRELEVLRLLVAGNSDRQIATALSISRRTAATHVANIYRKLDVTSRAAAAAYAVRNGLA